MAMVDYAVAQGIADPDKLGVCGWSYGGISTNFIITQTTRFKAAISGAGSFLYITNWGHDMYSRDWEIELGLPWENRELWEKLSPFNRVTKIKTPSSGSFLYITNWGHDMYSRDWEIELGLPWENRELWEKLSPFNRVTKIKTP